MWRRSLQPHGRLWWCAALAIAAAGSGAWLTWREVPPAPSVAVATKPGFALPAYPGLARTETKGMPTNAGWPTGWTDVVGSAPDFKRVFDDFAGSTDPRQRRIAARAFDACLPAFLPGEGQSASPENLIAGLPAEQHAQREAAYRALFARCHRLVGQARSTLEKTRLALHRDASNTSPGMRAQERLLAGETGNVEALMGEVLSGGDASDVADLAGMSSKLVDAGTRSEAAPAAIQSALETDAALSLVSCDLGRDCTAESLWALQLCAAEALCDGDVADRLVLRNTLSGIDAGAVDGRRRQLRDAIRAGSARDIFRLPGPPG